MKRKKICIIVVSISIVLIIAVLTILFFRSDKFIDNRGENFETLKNDITNLNILLDEKAMNEIQLGKIEEIIDTTNNNINNNDVEEQTNESYDNNEATNQKYSYNLTVSENDEKTNTKVINVQKTQTNSKENTEVKKEPQKNETENLKNETVIENTNKENINKENKEENNTVNEPIKPVIPEETKKPENQEIQTESKNEDNKKQNVLNSIRYSSETYRKNGSSEFKFNKAEALRTAEAIIDETFKYDKFWNNEKPLFKIEFRYIADIMQDSMYFPYRSTAIVSAVKNKGTNGTFYIWAEDYFLDGKEINVQYCIR